MVPAPRARHLVMCVSALFTLALAGFAAADTVILAPLKDNTLIEAPDTNSNGGGDGIYVGRVGTFGNGTKRRGVIAFDLASIPAGATIDAVTLSLQMAQTQHPQPVGVGLHRLNADWGEAGSVGSGSGAPAQPDDATWIHRFYDTTPWTSSGGDFEALASATQSVGDVAPYAWTGAGLVADVQGWLEQPASNFGWLVLGDESTSGTVKKFYSRQGFTPPALTVDYTPSTTAVGPPQGPGAVRFAPPWPSPASGPVHLAYSLPREARVSISILDVSGRIVRRLAALTDVSAGSHAVVWDGRRDSGAPAASGVYLARLEVDGRALQRRITLLR